MAGKVGGAKGGPVSEPNVIPFIDILLVLLIIFMVTAPIPTVDIRVDLPPPNPVHIPIEGQRPTIIVLQELPTPQIYVDAQPVTLAQLGDVAFDHAVGNNPAIDFRDIYAQARVLVRADQSAAYGEVVNVMSLLQKAGFVKVGIFAETASEG
jgi:biopolymer transport protein ExbD